ncbi:folliculin-interacting protein middle domain-containing protein [Gigaspora rosea]|uniref:Folliculin-interacting protein middle domain-containing protein n=1 Tax=Gigaspora rosea TaxID=44941 RepID=A0A397UGC1_9GLOM|nr:folliculin-interacting protein middle domain-containing protein [Gigaspora rosea]
MLQKLFRSKPTTKHEEDKYAQSLLGADPWSPPPFDANQIRVIVCQDTGDKAKLTLFDSAYSTPPNSSNDRDHANIESSSWSGVSFLAGNFLPKSSSAINIKSSTSTHPRIQDSIHNNRRSFDSVNLSNANTLPSSNRSPRKAAHNIDLIGDMMFGTVPLSYKGMTTKIHLMKSPKPQILLTKLFSINPSDLESNSSGRRGSFSSTSSDTSMSSSTQGSVMTTNGPRNTSKPNSDSSLIFFDDFSELNDEESFRTTNSASLPSLFHAGPPILGLRTSGASITSTLSLSTSPRNTFTNRRLRRFSHTSMENGIFNPTPLPGNTTRLDQLTGNQSLRHPPRSFVYSVGVVLSLEDNHLLESFVFSHFALLENRLHQLYSNVFKLICHLLRKSPASSSISGPNSIFNSPNRHRISASSLSSLILQNEPFWLDVVTRFKTSEPLWLTMSTFPHKREKLAKSFMSELSYLLEKYDDENSNLYPLYVFFISTLITSILMYHLSWVPTVADFEERNGKNLFYDPLWAQLGDLYGTIGTPSVMSRTIIVGTDENTVRRILFILSYFIRCNEIFERSEDIIPLELQLEEESKTSSNYDKNLLSESTQSDGNSSQKVEAETLSTQNINESNDNVSNDIANKGDANNGDASNDNKSNDNKSNDNKSNDNENKEDTNINHNKSHTRSESRHKRVMIDFPFTDISVENFLDVPMPKSQIRAMVPDPSPTVTDIDKNATNTKVPLSADVQTTTDKDKNVTNIKGPLSADELFVKSYGRSLMAGYSEKYMSDFVLIGLPKLDEFQDSLETDLKNSLRMQPFSSQDQVSKSICILGQLNTLSCSILGCEAYNGHIIGGSPPVTVQEENIRNVSGYFVPSNTKSDYINTTLHQCKNLYTKIGMPAESCLEYLEDQLRILYHKAIMYKNYFAKSSPPDSISSQYLFVKPSKNEQLQVNILEALGLHESDIQLVDAVSSTL